MPKQKGLLTPADVVNQTTGLLHHPDLLLEQLLRGGMMGTGGVVARSKPPSKAALDPHGISQVKLDRPWTEIPYTRVPNVAMTPRNVVSPEQFYAKHKGGVMLPVPGDKATAGELVTSMGGNPVSVQTHGGGPFMRLGYGGVWASEKVPTGKLSKQIEQAQRKFDTENVLITHATMGPRAIDFSKHPSDVIVQQLPYAKISRAGAKAVKERMAKGLKETAGGGEGKRYTYPDFPGINSPKLAEWLAGSANRRKHFVKLMDSEEMLKVGVPSVGAARLATTDVEQLGAPWMSSGMEIARAQPGLLMEGVTRHPSYPAQTPGQYEASLGKYVPMQNMFPDWYNANVGVKQNLNRAFEWGGVDRAQPINQQWLDQLMRDWSKLR